MAPAGGKFIFTLFSAKNKFKAQNAPTNVPNATVKNFLKNSLLQKHSLFFSFS